MRPAQPRLIPYWAIGLAAVVLTVIAFVLAFSRELPFRGGYELNAVFGGTQAMSPNSPVRIAGVEVGKVTEVRSLVTDEQAALDAASGREDGEGAVLVTMRISPEGLPIRRDARLRIRPRLFLEGNYFVDLAPGSPGEPEVPDGGVIPLQNTSSPVQLDQVLTTLQKPVREELRSALGELADGLVRHGGARGLNRLARASGDSFRYGAVVGEATLGTEPGDLREVIRNLGTVLAALDRNEVQLQELIVNLDTVSGALAAEAASLERGLGMLPGTIEASDPAFDAVLAALPEVRSFARAALPGVRSLPPALDAAGPLIAQLRALVSRSELRAAAKRLRRATPALTRLTSGTIPFLGEGRALASCFSETVIPWTNMTVPDPETPATGKIFHETTYGLVGIGGESRNHDANGPYARVLAGGGPNTVVFPPLAGTSDAVVGVTPQPILGARPALDSSAKTPFRPDVACETNDPPNLDSGDAGAPPAQSRSAGVPDGLLDDAGLRAQLADIAAQLDRSYAIARNGARRGLAPARVERRARGVAADAIDRLDTTLAAALGWEGLLGIREPGATP